MEYALALFFSADQPYRIYPDRDDEEYQSLCRQIAEHGLIRPIVCTPEGHILSGHRRRRALEHLGWTDYPVEIVVGLNAEQKWARVHLENRHRVLSTAEKQQLGRAELIRNPQLSDRAIADLIGVCKETIAGYRRALEEAEEIPRADIRIARNGQVHPAAKPRHHPVYTTRVNQAPRHADTLGRIDTQKLPGKVVLTNRDIVRAANEERREALASSPLVRQPADARIIHCDFRRLAARAKLQPGEANLIWTDFPWSSDWLRKNGEAVLEFATEYLAENGAIATYYGNCPWVPELMQIMGKSLHYRGMLINLNQSQKKDRVFILKLARKARPIHVWSKAPNWTFDANDLGFITDVYQGDPSEKEGHDWAQPVGESVHWLAKLSRPGDLIVDICAGTGTSGVAVRRLGEGRRWIGCEIEEKTYRIARTNLAAALPDGVASGQATRTPRRTPAPALVEMADGTAHRLDSLLSQANYKQVKGQGYLSMGLTLTPRDSGGSGQHLCAHATEGCAASCFAGWDRLAWPNAKRAMVARTLLLARDPDQFRAMVLYELQQAQEQADERGVPLVCRMNVVSDIPWEREWPELFIEYPRVRFMDYTKHVDRVLAADRPGNYHLTFSRSEDNEADCRRVLEAGRNVVVVFREKPLPKEYWGYPVIDGDRDDLRFLDPSPAIVGVVAKGAGARRDRTGFVVDL